MLLCLIQRETLRKHCGHCRRSSLSCAICYLLLAAASVAASGQAASAPDASASTPQVVITLEEAIHRAQANDPAYATSSAASRVASIDRSIAVAGLLPNAHLLSQDIYTRPNGIYTEGDAGQTLAPLPSFVANDARPWEYMAQGVVDETLSLAGTAAVRRANAAAAQAAAELEIARRGLVSGVTVLFYSSLAHDHKLAVAQTAHQDAADFTKTTSEREQAREAAHADVLKAQLEELQRARELQDTQVEAEKARLELAVLLFPDPRTPYTLSAPQAAPPLAPRQDIGAAAAKNNPELASALAALRTSNADVQAARAAYLPDFKFNYTYGIDANQFAVNGPLVAGNGLTADDFHARNLGYSTTFTVNLPVWDWLSTEHKVKQSEILRNASQIALSAAQRKLIAKLDEAYSEAAAARDQFDSLEQSVSMAAESLRLTKLAYRAGEATVLEVVDAQNAYVTAENAREDGRVRYETARANLQTITGTM